jgi:tetratricopeptide (TPR) repeat protein
VTANQTQYYFIGGTMTTEIPSYVRREADAELVAALIAGQFCYVLTPHQTGKSSLMVRTEEQLRKQGVEVVAFELTGIGSNLTADQWYEGLLHVIRRKLDPHKLGLDPELKEFWSTHSDVGPLQRWLRCLREVVLERIKGDLVIFVDEIQYVLNLPFSTDEFFAGIRELHNRRSEDPELNRLTFCLLGVAAPSDLIADTGTTPFNIGTRIELTDFDEVEITPLVGGMGRADATARHLLKRVLYWTGGHPYLTQCLCQEVAIDSSVKGVRGIDKKCKELFLSAHAHESSPNLEDLNKRIVGLDDASRASVLDIYQRIRRGKRVFDDDTNAVTSILRLSGMTRSLNGSLRVRNRIYQRAFGKSWVMANMPDAELRRQKVAYRKGLLRATGVALAVFLAMMVATGEILTQRHQLKELLEISKENEKKAHESERIAQENEKRATEAAVHWQRSEEATRNQQERAENALNLKEIAERNARLQARVAREASRLAKNNEDRAVRNAREIKIISARARIQEFSVASVIIEMSNRLLQTTDKTEAPYWRNIAGWLLSKIGAHRSSIQEYTEALSIDEHNLQALYSRSYEYDITGNPQGAVSDLEKYLKYDPNSAPAHLNLGYGQGEMRQYDAARQSIELAIKELLPGPGETLQTKVADEITRRTYRTALFVNTSSLRAALLYELANLRAYEGGEGFEHALGDADRVLKHERQMTTLGMHARKDLGASAAQDAYLFALNWAYLHLEGNQADYGAWASIGALWERADFAGQALTSYIRFRSEYRLHPDARYSKLAIWVEGRVKALKVSDSSNRDQPELGDDDVRALILEAEVSISRFYHETNVRLTNVDIASIRPNEDKDTTSRQSDSTEADRKRYYDALKRDYLERIEPGLKRAAVSHQDNIDLMLVIARLYGWESKYDDAEQAYNVILSHYPRSAAAWQERAEIRRLRNKGADKTSAIADLRRSIELNPTDGSSIFELAEWLFGTDGDEALGLFRRSLEVGCLPRQLPYAYGYEALELNKKKLYQEALEKTRVAIGIKPEETTFYQLRAVVQLDEGKLPKERIKSELITGYEAALDLQIRSGKPASFQEYHDRFVYLAARFSPTDEELAELGIKISEAIRDPKDASNERVMGFWRGLLEDKSFKGHESFIRNEIARLGALRKH